MNNNFTWKPRITRRKLDKATILIGERPTDARDNGYFIFKYIRENYPNTDIYYIIKKESPDYVKVNSLGNVIEYDSEEHIRLFEKASVLISTHSRGTIEPSYFDKTEASEKYPEYYEKKYIFIQHGINVSDFTTAFHNNNKVNAGFSKIICGALPEYRYLSSNLGYQKDVVAYTGLARFDSILQNRSSWSSKRKILFMPTWRSNICTPSYKKKKMYNDYRFLNSEYYSRLLSLLNSDKLQKILMKSATEFHFIPHPEVKKYLHYITTKHDMVKIVDPDTIDIQMELIEAKLLITDYSSVFFDFAFMKKPILFYQFDKIVFFSKHYNKGYFDFNQHYFGDVVSNEKELLSKIRRNLFTDYEFPTESELTHKQFFLKYDENNCERIYREIKKTVS